MLFSRKLSYLYLLGWFACCLGFIPIAHASRLPTEHHYKDWIYRCIPSKRHLATHSCEVSQAVQINRHGHLITILELALSKPKRWHYMLTILAPLNLYLPSGFEFVWGKHHSKAVPFLTCTQQGCLAKMPVTRKLLIGWKHHIEAIGLFRLANGKEVRLIFSLKGFNEAFAALQKSKVGLGSHR